MDDDDTTVQLHDLPPQVDALACALHDLLAHDIMPDGRPAPPLVPTPVPPPGLVVRFKRWLGLE